MNQSTTNRARREFLKGAGAAAGAMALVSSAGLANANADEESPSPKINAMGPTPKQMQGFLSLPDDGPIVMVNLIKFKPDGGAAEYAKYGAAVRPLLEKVGAKILFAGDARFCLIGQADWDAVALVEYPRKEALIQMASSPEYRAIHHHREAGLEGQVNYAVAQSDFGNTE
jgi:uncharacterized protein (DUF1330 family)